MKESNIFSWGSLKGAVCIDTGLFIEFFSESKLGSEIAKKIFDNPEVTDIFIHDLLISEIFYIFCRQEGKIFAQKIVNDLLSLSTLISSEKIRLIAGEIKCHRTISLADCYSCAVSIFMDCPVIFKEEEELTNEYNKEKFDFDIRIIN